MLDDLRPEDRLDDLRDDDLRLELLERLLLDRLRPFVSPDFRRCLFTVAAAICLARRVLRPCFFADALMCSYCRARLALFTPLGGIEFPS